jgi:hypothetical protein
MNRILTWMAIAGLGLALTGCGGGGTTGTNEPDPAARFINGSCDTTSLEFVHFVDGVETILQTGIGYLGSSTTFFDVEPEDLDLGVREVGTTEDLWNEVFAMERDKDYLICVLGLKTFGIETEKRLRIQRYLIDRNAPNANKSRIYVVHGLNRSSGNQTTGIDFQNPGNNPQYKLTDIAYLNEQHIDIDSTTHTFEARRFGTESIYVQRTFAFESGKIYVVLLSGVEDGIGTNAASMEIIELQSE